MATYNFNNTGNVTITNTQVYNPHSRPVGAFKASVPTNPGKSKSMSMFANAHPGVAPNHGRAIVVAPTMGTHHGRPSTGILVIGTAKPSTTITPGNCRRCGFACKLRWTGSKVTGVSCFNGSCSNSGGF